MVVVKASLISHREGILPSIVKLKEGERSENWCVDN